jgi:hypothetical protein
MTMTSLLRHVGIHVPRGVTVDGRLLVGAPAVAAIKAGTATAVAPTFHHGGPATFLDRPDDPLADRYAGAWWNLDPAARDADKAAVEAAFPAFRYDGTDGAHDFTGVIDTGRGRFRVLVIGNPDGGQPYLVPVEPRTLGRREGRSFRRSPHLYDNGNLCVAREEDWHPGEHNTVTAIAWAAFWYATYTDWRLGGPWPTPGYQPR